MCFLTILFKKNINLNFFFKITISIEILYIKKLKCVHTQATKCSSFGFAVVALYC